MSVTPLDIALYLLVAGFAWLVVWLMAAPHCNRRPSEADWQALQASHPFLRFSARWNRPAKLLAVVTLTACMWSAMSGMDWPVPVALMVPGFAFLIVGVAWTYHAEFAKRRK